MIDDIPTRECFVALFDILGYKDLVKKSNLDEVFKTYRAARKGPAEMKDHLEALLQSDRLTIHNYSDTFLIYTSDIRNRRPEEVDETFLALLALCDSLFIAANENKLPIRGAITAGKLVVSDGIEIGEAIIKAYEMEQEQDWIGCWITQECKNRLSENAFNEHLKEKAIVKYNIPRKKGRVEQGYAYNWVLSRPFQLGNFHFLEKREWHDWSAERKHRNTWEFIKFIRNGH